jgi:L-ascorbate metabolism protein UlaG (beta-lactamase superfamily)
MKTPFLQDDAFLEDVCRAGEQPGLHLWWLGQSGFLVAWQGAHLLIDPYLSDSLTRKYAATDKPHVRMTARVVAPARLDFIQAVTSSHNHTDHLDAETLLPLLHANPELAVLVSQANRAFAAERLGLPLERLTGLRMDQPVQVGPFTFQAVPAAHEDLETDEHGDYRHIGLVVRTPAGALYHSGDCAPYPDLAERLRPLAVDVALLPINGRDPQRGVAGNFTGEEAAALAHAMGAGLVIPMHYDLFEFNTAAPDEFVAAAQRLGQPYHVLRNGERLTWTRAIASLPPRIS